MTSPDPDEEEDYLARPAETLGGRDQQIFGLLRRVAEIGEYRASWTEEDVARVALMLNGGQSLARRALAGARGRIRQLEREAEAQRQKITELQQEPVRKALENSEQVLLVSPLRARIIRDAALGKSKGVIARSLGMSVPAVERHLQRSTKQAGTETLEQALARILAGEITIVVKPGGTAGG